MVLKFQGDELNTLKIPIEECFTYSNSSVNPKNEEEICEALKHRSTNREKKGAAFDSLRGSNASYQEHYSSSSDNDAMDFDDFSEIGDEQHPGAPIHIPISVNLEIEKLNRANKYGLHTKTNKTDNCIRKDQKYIAL